MLFIFTIIILPIIFRVKIHTSINEGQLHAKLFLYKLLIIDIRLFLSDKSIYYKVGVNKPKKINFDLTLLTKKSTKKAKMFFITKVNFFIYFGGNVTLTTLIATILDAIRPILSESLNLYNINIKTVPIFFSNSLSINAEVRLFTNVMTLIIGLIYNTIFKLTNKSKETKNVI